MCFVSYGLFLVSRVTYVVCEKFGSGGTRTPYLSVWSVAVYPCATGHSSIFLIMCWTLGLDYLVCGDGSSHTPVCLLSAWMLVL